MKHGALLMSVKPEYADSIITGKKRVELRRRRLKPDIRTSTIGNTLSVGLELEDNVGERVDDLANDVDDALHSVDELENEPGETEGKQIRKVKDALEKAKDTVDEMENAQD